MSGDNADIWQQSDVLWCNAAPQQKAKPPGLIWCLVWRLIWRYRFWFYMPLLVFSVWMTGEGRDDQVWTLNEAIGSIPVIVIGLMIGWFLRYSKGERQAYKSIFNAIAFYLTPALTPAGVYSGAVGKKDRFHLDEPEGVSILVDDILTSTHVYGDGSPALHLSLPSATLTLFTSCYDALQHARLALRPDLETIP